MIDAPHPPSSSSSRISTAPSSSQEAWKRRLPWHRIQTRYRWGWCFLCIMVWGSILCLDRLLTYSFQTIAANSFAQHSSLSFISLLRSVVAALAGPPFAILEELVGNQTAWLAALASYVAGHAVTAASKGVPTYTAGITLYELGANGLVILQQILVARITSSRDRQLFLVLPQLSFLVWAFLSSKIFSALSDSWRWGVGMFAILGPIALLPLVAVLHYTPPSPNRINSKPKQTTDVNGRPSELREWIKAATITCSKADAIGLLLLGSGTTGILVPIILAGGTKGWLQARFLAPLLVSTLLIIPCFLIWQLRFAPFPLIPKGLFRSRTFLFGSLAEVLFLATFSGSAAYLPTYLYVAKGTSANTQQIVSSVFSFSYALGSIPIALIARYARRVKYIVVFGAILFTVGSGVLILTGPEDTPTLFRIIVSQILMGLGGSASMAVIPSMVQIDAQRQWVRRPLQDVKGKGTSSYTNSQGTNVNNGIVIEDDERSPATVIVSPQSDTVGVTSPSLVRTTSSQTPISLSLLDSDVGRSIAALNICQSLGSAIGNAIAGTLWSTFIPPYLTSTLTPLGRQEEVPDIFSAPLTWILNHPIGSDERNAVVLAYNRLWKLLMIVFTILVGGAIFAIMGMENLRLDDGLGHDHVHHHHRRRQEGIEEEVLDDGHGRGKLKNRETPQRVPMENEGEEEDRSSSFVDLLGQTFFKRIEVWCRRRLRGVESPQDSEDAGCRTADSNPASSIEGGEVVDGVPRGKTGSSLALS